MLIHRDNFIKMVDEIPFVREEIRKDNPRFTLEWSNNLDKFKYVVVQTMFQLYCIMAESLDEKSKQIRKLQSQLKEVNDSQVEDEVLAELTETPETPEANYLYPLQPVHMDRWAPCPEEGRIMFFESSGERSRYLIEETKDRHSSRVPDEYTSYSELPAVIAPKGYRENYTQYVYSTPLGVITYYIK